MTFGRIAMLIGAITCIGLSGIAGDVHAFNVLGCNFNFGDNPEGCLNDKINAIKNELNAKVNEANTRAKDA